MLLRPFVKSRVPDDGAKYPSTSSEQHTVLFQKCITSGRENYWMLIVQNCQSVMFVHLLQSVSAAFVLAQKRDGFFLRQTGHFVAPYNVQVAGKLQTGLFTFLSECCEAMHFLLGKSGIDPPLAQQQEVLSG